MSERPHLFLVCVDALRSDCFRDDAPVWRDLGRPDTPFLDELRRQSHVWNDAFASSSWTKPSVPSMITSLHPSEHGVLEVERDALDGASAAALPDEVPTLAEILQEAGYRTVGLAHNAQLDPSLGFERGYDHYACDAGTSREIVDRLLALAPWNDSPAFVHLHVIDPHWPFPPAVRDRADRHRAGRFAFHRMRAGEWKQLKDDLRDRRVVLLAEEIRFLRLVYRFAVEEVDRTLGLLLGTLRDRGILERSVVVFTADHGEELLDRGLVGHGQSLFDELIRVPLWVRVGSQVPSSPPPRGHDELASHVDLLPTLVGAAGLPVPPRVAGRRLLSETPPAYVYSEVKHKRRYRQAVTDGQWKLIRTFRFEREADADGHARPDTNNLEELFDSRPYRMELALFDLRADARERDNVFAREPDVADRLTAALDRWWEGRTPRGQHTRELEEELIRRLEALGYL